MKLPDTYWNRIACAALAAGAAACGPLREDAPPQTPTSNPDGVVEAGEPEDACQPAEPLPADDVEAIFEDGCPFCGMG